MRNLDIPVGISDFRKLRERGCYYIDKSSLITELLKTESTEVTLITRPRRFGKTLGMSMLAHFFDIREDSRELFHGLTIEQDEETCRKWMNQYPTLFFSFKDIDGLTFEAAREMLWGRIAELCNEHSYLGTSEKVLENDRKVFAQLADTVNGKPTTQQLKTSILLLMRMMQAYYGKKVILILDEYDVPISKANVGGYYEKMLDMMKAMMSTSLKDNASLCFAVITGCLRIGKESIFTGTNNFTMDTISDNRYNEFFGFTQKEVEQFLTDTGCQEQAEMIREWYDGYRFGNLEIYCPWDVLNYIRKKLTEGIDRPENFWEHTSDNAAIRMFLERTDFDVTEKFERLLAGESIREVITENLTYDILTSSEENLWSLLYLTGYLTKTEKQVENGKTELRIPNAEVMDIFRKSVVEWFYQKTAKSDRSMLFTALWNGEEERLTELLSDLLFDTISFYDYEENFYHAFLVGLFSSAGYIVESNYENGLGRSDIVMKDRRNRRAIVIEVKIAKTEKQMEEKCQEALLQIKEKQYARKVERDGFRKVLWYGIAFYKKECIVRKN